MEEQNSCKRLGEYGHLEADILSKVKLPLQKLLAVWEEMGLSPKEAADSSSDISLHLCRVLDDLVGPHVQAKERLQQEVEAMEACRQELCSILEHRSLEHVVSERQGKGAWFVCFVEVPLGRARGVGGSTIEDITSGGPQHTG